MFKSALVWVSVFCLCIGNYGCVNLCGPLPESIFFGGYEGRVKGPRIQVESPNVYTFDVSTSECVHKYDAVVKQRAEKILAEKHYDTYTISSYIVDHVRMYRVEFAGGNAIEQKEVVQEEWVDQWELYKHRKYLGEYDFKWLCKAAEQGDYLAQWELGYLHNNGLHGVRKDLVLSVMWYSLVEASGHNPAGVDTIRGLLTPEQINEAEHLYENWKPGRCEREIFGTEPNDSN